MIVLYLLASQSRLAFTLLAYFFSFLKTATLSTSNFNKKIPNIWGGRCGGSKNIKYFYGKTIDKEGQGTIL